MQRNAERAFDTSKTPFAQELFGTRSNLGNCLAPRQEVLNRIEIIEIVAHIRSQTYFTNNNN